MNTLTRNLPDEAATAALAQEWGQSVQALIASRPLNLALRGDLGAGKTTFARYLLRALGVTGRIKSPSYALMESYKLPGAATAWHADFYRLSDARDFEEAGFRDIFAAPGLRLVEWPQQLAAAGIAYDASLSFSLASMQAANLERAARQCVMQAHTPLGEHILQTLLAQGSA